MNLIDEQDVTRSKAGEDAREIAGFFQHGPRRRPHRDAHLIADHERERRLPEPRRACEQQVVERLAPRPRAFLTAGAAGSTTAGAPSPAPGWPATMLPNSRRRHRRQRRYPA